MVPIPPTAPDARRTSTSSSFGGCRVSDVLMEPTATAAAPLRPSRRGRKATGLRPRGTGGIVAVRPGVWRIDIEISRDPVTGRRRRVSRRVRGTRDDAEAALAKLRVADHDGRLPRPGTAAAPCAPRSTTT